MPRCPTCQTDYPDGVGICARDGQPLVSDAAATVGTQTIAAAPSAIGAAVATQPAEPAPNPNEAFDSLVGASLAGRYQIIRRIGEGGMGAVYEARHTVIGKRVAVKVLLEKFLAKSDFVARLLQEARLASAIGHEHIVDVTDFGTTDDGRAFVVMEYLDGESLAQLIMREAPLPVERSLRIASQVASALGAAHAKGIVHRDVKPENVYLVRRADADFIKVVDFGISKAVKQGQGDEVPEYRLTHTGLLLGTPLYMSPEQARGEEDLDERVDVWALGVMLYECLTGEVPFRANNYLGIISQVLTHEARPPSQLRPELGIPEAVESVVMHAMEKDRNRRYGHITDVERDLERLLAGDQNVGWSDHGTPSPTTTPPPPAKVPSRAWVWGLAAAALVGGVALALTRPADRPRADVTTPTTTTPTTTTEDPQVPGAAPGTRATALGAGLPAPGGATTPEPATQEAVAPQPAAPADAPAGDDAKAAERGDGEPTGKVGPPTARTRRDLRQAARAARARADEPAEEPAGAHRRRTSPLGTSSEAVLRGALPSRSGEGYPDQ